MKLQEYLLYISKVNNIEPKCLSEVGELGVIIIHFLKVQMFTIQILCKCKFRTM